MGCPLKLVPRDRRPIRMCHGPSWAQQPSTSKVAEYTNNMAAGVVRTEAGSIKCQDEEHTEARACEMQPQLPHNTIGRAIREEKDREVDFAAIRSACESTSQDVVPGAGPEQLAAHRRLKWPNMSEDPKLKDIALIYQQVRAMGLPNSVGAHMQVPSSLNIKAWEYYLTRVHKDEELLSFIKYGFPMGYVGPTTDTTDVGNHASAVQFSKYVDRFVEK